MNPGLLSPSLLIAGAVAALGPVLIHLLNRRRHRVVPWAAMDFVREATTRTRRFVRIRDLALLFLRVAAVVLFGLALSRPFLSSRGVGADPHQPVHAVIVVDNSLSMSLEEPAGTVLSRARQQAKELIDELPTGGRISIIPLCGPTDRVEREAFRSPQDARAALDRIEIVDRTETAAHLIPLVQEALERAPELKARRIVFLSDQQQAVWPVAAQESVARDFPDLEVLRISPASTDNSWVADLTLENDYAEPQSPTPILVAIRCEGAPRANVAVSLQVGGMTAATQYVDLSSGENHVVRFLHEFQATGDAGHVQYVPVTVSLENDRLPLDDSRSLVVPVVSSLPIVFVDQYGREKEDVRQSRLGETFFLRQLLTPDRGNDTTTQSAYSIRHVTIDNLTQSLLQDARLVVIAGIATPGLAAGLLRDYVLQGGQLLIAAGGEFSPQAWSRAAWDNGRGILPVPLLRDLRGTPPTSTASPTPFFLDPSTMTDGVFQIPDASREDLEELYRTPAFFVSAIVAANETDTDVIQKPPASTAGPRAETQEPETSWLQWRPARRAGHRDDAEARALARFSNGDPFLIERDLGDGTVLLALSGIGSDWNNLPRTNAVVLLDRLLRRMLRPGLPERTVETFTTLEVPLAAQDRRMQFECQRPDGTREALTVEALGPEEYGVVLRNLSHRGIYRVAAVAERSAGPNTANVPATPDVIVAVNGPEAESNLMEIESGELASRLSPESSLSTSGAAGIVSRESGSRREFWRVFLWCSLACLVSEMGVLWLVNARAGRLRSSAGG